MPSLFEPNPTPEKIRRDVKIKWMINHLNVTLRVDIAKFRVAFKDYGIVDTSCRVQWLGDIASVQDHYVARGRVTECIINEFIQRYDWWMRTPFTRVLALNEYSEIETAPRMRHEFFDVTLSRGSILPDLKVHLMYPIQDINSETQKDYIFRAFVTMLAAEMFDLTFDEAFLRDLLNLGKAHWTKFFDLIIKTLETYGNGGKLRILVILHNARVTQAVELVKFVKQMHTKICTPIFQFLISGDGADKVAEEVGCLSVDLSWPDQFFVEMTQNAPGGLDDEHDEQEQSGHPNAWDIDVFWRDEDDDQ